MLFRVLPRERAEAEGRIVTSMSDAMAFVTYRARGPRVSRSVSVTHSATGRLRRWGINTSLLTEEPRRQPGLRAARPPS